MSKVILLCRVDGNFGGVERHLLSLAKGLDPRRFHPVVVPIANRGELARFAEQSGIETEFLPMKSRLHTGQAVQTLIEIAWRRNAALLHTFGLRSNTLGAQAAKALSIPWIVRLPNINRTDYNNPLRGWISHWRNNQLIRRADALQVISPQLELYVKSWKRPPKRTYLIPNGVDLSLYNQEDTGAAFRQRFEIPPEAPLLGSVGRLERVKGYDILLDAYSAVVKQNSHIRLVLIGDGPEREQLEKQAAALALPHPVIFTGYTPDVPSALAALTMFVCSSRSEGVPNAMLEAMAMARPIVSTRVGGVDSVLEGDQEGILVPTGESNALASAIVELLSNPQKMNTLGKAAHERVERDFSVERMIERAQGMYEDFLCQNQDSQD